MQGYRHPGDRRRLRRPLGEVVLAGPPRVVALGLAALRGGASILATLALFLPWHDVRTTGSGGLCWAPDCKGTPNLGPSSTCPSWVHVNPVAGLLLVGLVVAALARWQRPRVSRALGLCALELVVLVAVFFLSFDLKHMFDIVTARSGQILFQSALFLTTVDVVLDLVSTPLLYLWARARLPPLEVTAVP